MCVLACVHVCACMCTCVCLHMYECACICMCVHACVHVYACACMCTCVCLHVYMCVLVLACVHVYACACMCTCVCLRVFAYALCTLDHNLFPVWPTFRLKGSSLSACVRPQLQAALVLKGLQWVISGRPWEPSPSLSPPPSLGSRCSYDTT